METLRKEDIAMIQKLSSKQEAYTIEDIIALPEGTRAELINGQIYYIAPPNRGHQRIVTEVSKLFQYRTAGVREYWVVDADRDIVTVYNFDKDDMQEYTFSDKVGAGIYQDLEIDFSEIVIE